MDVSPYENANIIFDLNSPDLPDDLMGKFDYIIDGGTTEHVFNCTQAFANIVYMLNLGGKVINMIPSNGYINHGYYQFSPSVLTDFYTANGLLVEQIDIVFHKLHQQPKSLDYALATVPDYRLHNFRTMLGLPDYNGFVRCIAVKKEHRDVLVAPQQSYFYSSSNRNKMLMDMWAVDLKLSDEKTKIGIYGIDDNAKAFLEIIREHPDFSSDKIVGFFVSNVPEGTTMFSDYPVRHIDEATGTGTNIVFMSVQDNGVQDMLRKQGINVVSLLYYQRAFSEFD